MGTNERVISAVQALPRDRFIEMSPPSPVMGRSIPPAHAVSQILEYLDVQPDHTVLQVGTGAGYVAALLSRLAAKVVTIELNPAIAREAQARFNALKLANLVLREQDGSDGAPDLAPFDRIVVSSPRVRKLDRLLQQLSDDGLLLALEQGEHEHHMLISYRPSDNGAPVRKMLTSVDFFRDAGMTLLDLGLVDQALLSESRREARENKQPVIMVLREKLDLEDATLYRKIAEERRMHFSQIDELLAQVQPELMESFSSSFLDSHHLIPFRSEDRVLHVATDDPDSDVEDLYHMYRYEQVVKTLVTPSDFKRLWTTMELSRLGDAKQLWKVAAEQQKQAKEQEKQEENEEENFLRRETTRVEARLITLFDALLIDAVSEGASDLHIEHYAGRTRIRLRVDGDLHDITHYALSPREARGLVNVIKIRAEMDIAEKRLPQGGRSQLRAAGKAFDLRIQVQPSLHGEAVVIRLLPQSGNVVAIEDLGMSSAVMRDYRRMLENPSGLVLVVGPTGSGKSTTLYAGLSELAKDTRRKVLTIEDPIEYSMEGIQQTWTRHDIGFNFADGMRSFVRLDPDVILVGEIRDTETALEAIRASQTGHVVLSTLHSNDAVDALQRLYDLEVQPNSVASELMAVIAQKLAKRICADCRVEAKPDAAILEELFPDDIPDNFRCYEGKGCENCNGRGTRGRVAVVEYMQVGSEIRNAISQKYPIAKLRAIALDCGLTTMRDSGLSHVINGVIPLTELRRVLPADRMAPEERGAH